MSIVNIDHILFLIGIVMTIPNWKLELINWEATKQKYNYQEQSELNDRSKVLVNCVVCKEPELDTTVRSMRIRSDQKKKGQTQYIPICKSCQQKRTWAENEEFRKKQSTIQSEAMKKVWKDEEYRKNIVEKVRVNTTERWKDIEFREKVIKGVKEAHIIIEGYTEKATKQFQTEESSNKRIASIKNKYQTDPSYKKRISDSNKIVQNDPEYRKRMRKIHDSIEYRQKCSQSISSLILNKQLFINCKVGWHESAKAGKVHYRSSYELKLYELLDNDQDVIQYEVEPFIIQYHYKGFVKNYMPDLLVHYGNGKQILIEIKPYKLTQKSRNMAKIKAAIKYCRDKNMKFRVMMEKDIFQ